MTCYGCPADVRCYTCPVWRARMMAVADEPTPDEREIPAPCPECGGDGGFEHVPEGRWSTCTWCGGTGEVESEFVSSLHEFEERVADIPEDR